MQNEKEFIDKHLKNIIMKRFISWFLYPVMSFVDWLSYRIYPSKPLLASVIALVFGQLVACLLTIGLYLLLIGNFKN